MTDQKQTGLYTPERPNFFNGQLLMQRDFELLLDYPREKMELTHRTMHGTGIIHGLWPDDPTSNGNSLDLDISSGLALDPAGRELINPAPNRFAAEGETRDGVNYLYLRFTDKQGEPMAGMNNKKDKVEVCHTSSYFESFTVINKPHPPVVRDCVLTGIVFLKEHPGQGGSLQDLEPIVGARVQAIRDGIIVGSVTTDREGRFKLDLPNGNYTIRVSAPGISATLLRKLRLDPGAREVLEALISESGRRSHDCEDHDHAMADLPDPGLEEDCDVFLGAVNCYCDRGPDMNLPETLYWRKRVFPNPALASLLLDHINDQHNPHNITAAELGAISSINNVRGERIGDNPGNIELVCPNNTLRIKPHRREHHIHIEARPAREVQSIGPRSDVGHSPRFAREDHVHDLQEHSIGAHNLKHDMFTSSDNSIRINHHHNHIDLTLCDSDPGPEIPTHRSCICGTAYVTADGGGRGSSQWINHPYGPKPIFVEVGMEKIQADGDSNDLLMGDLEALPDFKVFFQVNKAPKFAVRLDIQGCRFKIFAQNNGLKDRSYTVHYWIFDH